MIAPDGQAPSRSLASLERVLSQRGSRDHGAATPAAYFVPQPLRPGRSLALSMLCTFLLGCLALACEAKPPVKLDPTLEKLVTDEQWKASNHGRIPLRDDGYFDFPEHVTSVVVDVGAYKLRRTNHFLREDPHVAIVAIEPLAGPWTTWPDETRIIGLPVAISLERGMLSFNVNSTDVTSSLLETTPNSLLSTKTVEVRKVPGVRLEDIMERIPPSLPIIFLKTDIQGMDLAALMSAGQHLRRVKAVHSEIVNDKSYEKHGEGSMGSEKEFTDYMKSMGFSIEREVPAPQRIIVDTFYKNDNWG